MVYLKMNLRKRGCTSYNDEGRVGFRVEIQALYYALYDSIIFIERLVKSPFTNEIISEQKRFTKKFRETFIVNNFSGYLIDGKNFENHTDRTFRPNVFLAAYLAPDLLTKKEWNIVFDSHLKNLYLPWGGLSTIGHDNSLYQPTYTGQDNRSYHRGDSWYFVNNIAAIVMDKFGSQKYQTQVRSIEHASARDCVELGFIGHCSEVSSSSFQEAQGSMAQAWSASTFLELTLLRYGEDD
jgi:glycogen debranching enzyme